MAKETPFVGEMDRKVTVHKVDMVPDSLSTPVPTPVLVASPWVKMIEKSGSQDVDGAIMNVVDRSYIIRRNSEIAKSGLTMKVTDGDMEYEIHAIREMGRSHLELHVRYAGPATLSGGGGGGGQAPVITNNSPIYVRINQQFNLPILTEGEVTGYGASFLPSYLGINTNNGIISGMIDGNVGIVGFQIMASNQYGGTGKSIELRKVDYDVDLLQPPRNLEVVDYNASGVSFTLAYEILYYRPQYERLEVFIDDVLYRTLTNNINEPYVRNTLMQRVFPPFEYDTPYALKMRFRSTLGDYSDFSEEIIVTIPEP